jgi:GT2 family glycosyltransferase
MRQLEEFWSWYSGEEKSFDWIVVDNNSVDGTVEYCKLLGARVIKLDSNIGFSRANNIGLGICSTKYVLFANPDLGVVSADLEVLKNTLVLHPGLVAPQLINDDGSIQKNGRGLPYLSAKLAHREWIRSRKNLDNYAPTFSFSGTHSVSWVMGAAVASSVDLFRNIGMWDEKYFIYYEDHEIGLRCIEKGYEVSVNNTIRWHHGWARGTKKFAIRPWYYEFRSAFTFYRAYPKYFR